MFSIYSLFNFWLRAVSNTEWYVLRLFYARTDLIICRSPVSRLMADNADVGSRYYTDSDLEDGEVGDLGVAGHPCINHCSLPRPWGRSSANGPSGTSQHKLEAAVQLYFCVLVHGGRKYLCDVFPVGAECAHTNMGRRMALF
jgi:hypothetical protein